MSNRIKQIDRLLKENNFRLQHTGRKGRHLIYMSPRFSDPFVMPPNPVGKEIDWIYAGLKKLIEGHKADSSGRSGLKQVSMVLMAGKAEAAARALPQARRGRASRGTGFKYIDTTPRERTDEEIESARRAVENAKARQEKIRSQEEQRRAECVFVDSCREFVRDEVAGALQEIRNQNEARISGWHAEHRANFDAFWTFYIKYMAPEARAIRGIMMQKMTQIVQAGLQIFDKAAHQSRLLGKDENAGKPISELFLNATPAERADVRRHFDNELANDRQFYLREYEKKRKKVLKIFGKASAEYASQFAASRLGQLLPEEDGDAGFQAAQHGIAKWHASMAIAVFDLHGQPNQQTNQQTERP